jgi:hypothetical protein
VGEKLEVFSIRSKERRNRPVAGEEVKRRSILQNNPSFRSILYRKPLIWIAITNRDPKFA